VLISGDRIHSAGAILPLTQSPVRDRSLGTRHRAALGLSEETDAIVIVVSEETSQVAVAIAGALERGVNSERLRAIVSGTHAPSEAATPPARPEAANRSHDRSEVRLDSQYRLLTLFADGGLMMYPLVLCSMIALGVMIAKAWTLWLAHRGTTQVINGVEEAALRGDIDGAIEIAHNTAGPAAAILLAGLRRIKSKRLGAGELEAAVATTGTIELGFLERGLVILATIANVAPLMGFLGTVAGMILAFAAIEAAGDVDPSLVAGGIKVALLTTAAGLVVAVPVNIAYNAFVTRIDKLIIDMEQGAQKIFNLAWDLEKDGKVEIMKKNQPWPTDFSGGAAPKPAGGTGAPPAAG
jgi:biopolymer transport protein ExbB